MGAVDYLPHYTYDDYKLWEGDWELIEGLAIARQGSVAMSPAPMRKHQSLASAIIAQLYNQLDDCDTCEVLGEVDYKISHETTLRPDIALTCGEENNAYLTKAPEIIIEIISKATASRDETYKFNVYEAEKVQYYVIVYPNELYAKVYKLVDGKYDKQGDFSKETYDFEETLCHASINFNQVFKRFRK